MIEELKLLRKHIQLNDVYIKCLEENIRFRKFLIEYFDLIDDEEKERFVLLLDEFGALEWEKYNSDEPFR